MKNIQFDLRGKKALVTGSSRGIGRSIARALAAAGAEVVLHGIKKGEAATEAIIALQALAQAPVHFIEGNLSQKGEAKKLGEHVLQATGGVDVVVLNASIQTRNPWETISPKEAELQMQCNFLSSLELLQVLVPPMRQKKWGRILAIGSVQQIKPHPQMAVYAASKAAQMSLIMNLAKQLASDGITVNNLAPGAILTDRNKVALADPQYAEKVKSAIPAGSFGDVEDCANAALLLCSPAAHYITGQNLYVDGGMSLF